MKNIKGILEGIKQLHSKLNHYKDDFGFLGESFLADEIDLMFNGILDYYGVPKDNTDEELADEDYFCSDFIYDILWEYMEGKYDFETFESKIESEVKKIDNRLL